MVDQVYYFKKYNSPGTFIVPTVLNGLTFPSNATANSDIRLVWTGANLLPRVGHTVIWRANYVQQLGYYAVTWHSYNDGTFHGATGGNYEFGCHPYPADGTYTSGDGRAAGPEGSTGADHYHEIAGLLAKDFLCSIGAANGEPLALALNTWLLCARTTQFVTVSTSNDTIRHIHYPDLLGNPNMWIEQDILSADLESPSAPAFYFGCSDWETNVPGAGQNDETPSGTLRYFKLFNTALSKADILTEAASNSDAPVTSAGIAAKWYSNINPKPTDITDKSGAGHTPVWANANRPTLWTG